MIPGGIYFGFKGYVFIRKVGVEWERGLDIKYESRSITMPSKCYFKALRVIIATIREV